MKHLIRKVTTTILLTLIPLAPGSTVIAESPQESMFQAGSAKRSIVPPFPTRMGGFFDRLEDFTGVHDPIYARALVCSNGTTKVAVVTVDLIHVSWNLVSSVREEVERETEIPPENILISASHSHSAPTGFQKHQTFGGEFDEKLFEFLKAEMVGAVTEAHSSMRPAAIGHGSGDLTGTTRNRQQSNEDVIDTEVGVLKVWTPETREVIATFFNFTGHPVILGAENLEISGEYPGYAQRTVEEVLGGVAMFTQGACGDVTVHRSGPPYLEVARLGRVLAGEVIKTAELIRQPGETTLSSQFEEVDLVAKHVPTPDQAKDRLDSLTAQLDEVKESDAPRRTVKYLERQADGAETTLAVAGYLEKNPELKQAAFKGSVHVLQLGPLFLVGVPGELFVEYALEMKQRVLQQTGRPMVLVGFCNGYVGYLVTPRAKHTGGYEQAIARVDENAGRLLTETAMRLVNMTGE